MARPTKRTNETEQRLLNALEMGLTRHSACAFASVSTDTLARWARLPDFAEKMTAAESRFEARNLAIIHAAAEKGDWKAAAWLLERRRRDDYSLKVHSEVSGSLEAAMAAAAMSLEEKLLLADRQEHSEIIRNATDEELEAYTNSFQ